MLKAKSLTITLQLTLYLPSSVVAVIKAVPTPTALTLPLLSTVAILVLLLDHITFLSFASLGRTVAIKFSNSPLFKLRTSLFNFISETEEVTVTLQLALYLPSSVVAVIKAVPTPIALTLPLLSTVATLESVLSHVTAKLVASLGEIIEFNLKEEPRFKFKELEFKIIPVTGTITFTCTETLATSPLEATIVIVATPLLIPKTTPVLSTLAIVSSELCHFKIVTSE